jgi:hypothetical protein
MIDINPQLQSKIFDSLLLHMKAERKGEPYRRSVAPRGKGPKGKTARETAAGKPSMGRAAADKGVRGGSSGSGKSPRTPAAGFASPEWDSLAADLQRLGLNKTTADALVSWASSQAEQIRQSPVKIRVLHPMEREFISIDAYDYLLELYRLGLIGPPQLENLIENCAYLTNLPASRDAIAKMALRAFSENLELQGLGSSH